MTNNLKEILELHAQEFKAGHLDKVEQSVQALINQKEKELLERFEEAIGEDETRSAEELTVAEWHAYDGGLADEHSARDALRSDLRDRIKQLKEELKGGQDE